MGQVAKLLSLPRMREPGPPAIPGEPHQATLWRPIWPNSGEMGEEGSVEKVLMAGGGGRVWHRGIVWSVSMWSGVKLLLHGFSAANTSKTDPEVGIMQRPEVGQIDRHHLYSFGSHSGAHG